MKAPTALGPLLDEVFAGLEAARRDGAPALTPREIGTVDTVGPGIATVRGLPGAAGEELLRFPGDTLGVAFNLDPGEVGVVLLDRGDRLESGDEVRRTGRVLDVPVGEALLGRAVDALGRPVDRRGPVRAAERRPVERSAPAILARAPVEVPLQTGIKSIDALVPIGRGQRELILGDRQTGKTTVALDTIANQRGTGVLCVYCAVGKQTAALAKVVERLRADDALDYTAVVLASGDAPPGLQFVAPFAATTMAEYFMDRGDDVLVIYDDLTWHARAYRELSLLLRRPPGREAFPGDIFYVHARLLERATHLRPALGGGSLTALPIIETEAQNLAAYLPTNLISITDGQIYLSPTLAQRGLWPAVDVGRSVSRVGGKAQLPAYRAVAGPLRLAYAQFSELETFARFSTRLDEATRAAIERGRRVREALKQPAHSPLPVEEQIAVMLAAAGGVFDAVPAERVAAAELDVRRVVREHPELTAPIAAGRPLDEPRRAGLLELARSAVANHVGEE